ncbi:MAG: MYXO-CTERM sorting domain-containing protein [Proteobacteria bacterium]|nr:MYXO-CTERM sorting domain-containing protein [Pseudomonadota bacterium]
MAIAIALLAMWASAAPADEVRQLKFHHNSDGALHFVQTETVAGAQVFWSERSQVLIPHPAGTVHLSGDREFEIIERALDAWNAAALTCGDGIRLTLGEPEPGEVGFDRINRIVFRDERWCAPIDCDAFCGRREDCRGGEVCHNPSAAGLTTLCYNVESGEILDADIELNGVSFAISDGGLSEAGGSELADLANTFTHEVGHFIGLDHTCWNPENGPQPSDHQGNLVPDCRATALLTPEIREATMFATQTNGETKKATLEQDDIDGLCRIYPADTGGCGCTAGSGNPGSAVLLVFALVLAVLPRSRQSACRAGRFSD